MHIHVLWLLKYYITECNNIGHYGLIDQNDVLVVGVEESRGADANIDVTAINPDDLGITNSIVPLAVVPPQPPVGTIPNPRRKPCYGWVSDEDEESDDIVYVPARLPEKPPARLPEKPRRKTRWDVPPDEI